MFFTFPEDARWNAERQAVEFRVEIGEYRGVALGPVAGPPAAPARAAYARTVCRGVLPSADPGVESIAERKLRRRQLTEDGNVEISGRDLR
jgi:hypothetical protein